MTTHLKSLIDRWRAWWRRRLPGWRRADAAPDLRGLPRAGPAQRAADPPRCVSVVIPALNEAARIADVVRHALADPFTGEVIVVDDSSIDDTALHAGAAGARVILSRLLGKGASMQDGARAAQHDVVVYLDGDLAGLRPGLVGDLARPAIEGSADFVKARFGRSGGRVTELTAKPMLKVFFPELAHFTQPLGGLIAARRELLLGLSFEDGYGVDVGLLIDALRAGAALAEVDVGSVEHDSQPLHDLTLMANEVARVIYSRARAAGRLHVEQIVAMYETQRQAAASLDYVLMRRRGRTKMLLLDMDGTVTPQRYVEALAQATGRSAALAGFLDRPGSDDLTRSEAIAGVFRFVHRSSFEQVALDLPLRPGVIEWVRAMRRAGFMVGLVSDSWFVGAEIVRRRLFADFALAHVLQFEGDVNTGRVHLNPAFRPLAGRKGPPLCKSHVVARLQADLPQPRVSEIWAIGDNANDLGMLSAADRAFVIEPKLPGLARQADATEVSGFGELLPLVPRGAPVGA